MVTETRTAPLVLPGHYDTRKFADALGRARETILRFTTTAEALRARTILVQPRIQPRLWIKHRRRSDAR